MLFQISWLDCKHQENLQAVLLQTVEKNTWAEVNQQLLNKGVFVIS